MTDESTVGSQHEEKTELNCPICGQEASAFHSILPNEDKQIRSDVPVCSRKRDGRRNREVWVHA